MSEPVSNIITTIFRDLIAAFYALIRDKFQSENPVGL